MVEANSPAIGNDGRLVEGVGLETLGGVFTPLLSVGCPVPCVSSEIFSTASDDQTEISIFYFRGAAKLTSEAHALGHFRIEGIPPARRGVPQIEVILTASGRDLQVEARDATSGAPVRIVRQP